MGALLVVLFCADEATARHDLEVMHGRLVEHDLPVSALDLRGFEITDRIGNGWCAAGLVRVRGG
jgi:hypothetical protein